MKNKKLAFAIAFFSASVIAEEQLPTSTVTANLSDIDKVVAADGQRIGASEGAQVITNEYIQAQQATTFADALRKTTSVQIDEEAGNQGSLVFIRGLTGDQISVRVDGAPKNFNQVRHGGANAIWLEPLMYKSVTVIPGAASNIYGNGSMGGVIQIETKDPEDLIREGQIWGAESSLGIETNGQSTLLSVSGAREFNAYFSGLAQITGRNTDPYEDGDGVETLGASTNNEDINYLIKTVVKPAEAQRIELSLVSLDKEYDRRGTVSRGLAVSDSETFTEIEDKTYSLQYLYTPEENPWLNLSTRVSRNEIERAATNYAEETNDSGDIIGSSLDDSSRSVWSIETTYAEIENLSNVFFSDEVTTTFRYGADYAFDDVTTAYDGLERERKLIGGYISATTLFGETVELIVSARHDAFENSDTNTSTTVKENYVSPKLQFNWRPFENSSAQGLSFFATTGKGFRAPSTHEAFGRGDGTPTCTDGRRGLSCNELVPNADLQPETTDSIEWGVAFDRAGLFTSADQLNLRLTFIDNEAEDYIVSQGLPDGTIEFNGNTEVLNRTTFNNIDSATFDGWEISVNYTNNDFFGSVTAQELDAETPNPEDQDALLRDVSPASINASLGAYLFDGKSRVGVDMSYREGRELTPEDNGDGTFSPNNSDRLGYTVWDLFASYQINKNFSLQARAENLFDKLYTKRYRSLSVDENGEQNDLTYYQPGRNFKITANYKF